MLTSYLRSDQTIDFTFHRPIGHAGQIIEMLMTDTGMRRLGTIKLTPLEALDLSDHLRRVVNYLNIHSTNPIQEKEPLLNLHPRAEQLLANADLDPATGEHNGTTRTPSKTSENLSERITGRAGGQSAEGKKDQTDAPPLFAGHQPARTMDSGATDAGCRTPLPEHGLVADRNNPSDLGGDERSVSVAERQGSYQPRGSRTVAEALAERGQDADQENRMVINNANQLPEPPQEINVEIDEDWVASIGRNDEVSALEHEEAKTASECTIMQHSKDCWEVMEPHGASWIFVSAELARKWAERINEENARWGDRPIDLPWFLTFVPVDDDHLEEAYHYGTREATK